MQEEIAEMFLGTWLTAYPRMFSMHTANSLTQFNNSLPMGACMVAFPYIHDTWQPNGNNKKTNFVHGYSNNVV